MSDPNDSPDMNDKAARDEEALVAPVALAGPHEDVPPETTARVYDGGAQSLASRAA